MRRSLILSVSFASALLLAACGGGDGDPAATAVTGDTSTAGTTADTAAPPATEAPPVTDAPVGTDAPAAGGDADCLQGSWRADAAELQRRIDAIGAPITFVVGPDSANDVVFDGETFSSVTEIAIAADVPGGITLSATGTNSAAGTFSVEGNLINGTVTDESSTFGDWEATLNGTRLPLPPEGFGDPPDVSPGFVGSTFTCDDTTLTFVVPGAPFGSITLTRQG